MALKPSSSPAAVSSSCVSERTGFYGIPPEQVVVSSVETKFEMRDGQW
jgi:hypothetical protein